MMARTYPLYFATEKLESHD